jgi:hypothetical protein
MVDSTLLSNVSSQFSCGGSIGVILRKVIKFLCNIFSCKIIKIISVIGAYDHKKGVNVGSSTAHENIVTAQ